MTALDLTKPVQTRDGRPARIICTDRKGAGSIIALVMMEDGTEVPWACLDDGSQARGASCPEDLINVPVKRAGWVNIENRRSGLHAEIFASEFEANEAAAVNCIACVRVEWEEPS